MKQHISPLKRLLALEAVVLLALALSAGAVVDHPEAALVGLAVFFGACACTMRNGTSVSHLSRDGPNSAMDSYVPQNGQTRNEQAYQCDVRKRAWRPPKPAGRIRASPKHIGINAFAFNARDSDVGLAA